MDLIEAARQGDITAVRDALEKGADINAKDSSGWTALTFASENGHTEIVRLLIEKGADVNAKNDFGITALMFASSVEIVRLLIEKGADINAKNDFGNTAVMLASERGNTETVRLFKEKGATGSEKYNTERYSKLSVASLIISVSAVPFGCLVFCMSLGDPQNARDWMIWYTINALYWIFFPLPAIVCGSIDLKRIKTGRSSNLGKRFDIIGIVFGGVLALPFLIIVISSLLIKVYS